MASAPNATPTIRSLPATPRYFWKHTTAEQIAQTVNDQNADYIKRSLPANEIAVLGLNEIAAEHRRGFFFYLPSRSSWTAVSSSERFPKDRVPQLPESQYPTMLFMDFDWSPTTYAAFLAEGHRARYLRACALTTPLADNTPLYALQYAFQKCPVYATTPNSLVLFATKLCYYFAQTAELEHILGTDQYSKLGSANWLWDRASLEKGKDRRKEKDIAMQEYRLQSLETVYHTLYRLRNNGLLETMTAQHLKAYIPRPSADATEVGSPLGALNSSDPSVRRGDRHAFAPRGKRRKLAEQEALDEELTEEPADSHGGRLLER